MKAYIKKALKRTLNLLIKIDRKITVFLGGQKNFRPQLVDKNDLDDANQLEALLQIDRRSFSKYERISKPPLPSRIYGRIRNKAFILLYRLGKKVLR
jgi:hypothetical protein